MAFRTEWISNKCGRESNQDACDFLMLEDGACWVVADGLGGHRGGEVAARLAVDRILDSFRRNREISPRALEGHLLAAHKAIVELQAQRPQLQTMRTTVVVLLSDYRSFLCGHVGDSRLYYIQQGRIDFQTRDHSVPQALADAGDISPDDVRHHEDRNRLLRALGMEEELRPSIQMDCHRLYRKDAFLLCVDGFWEDIEETEMEADLAKSIDPGDWLRTMECRIAGRAKAGHDNYTAIAVFFEGSNAPEPPPRKRVSRSKIPMGIEARRPGILRRALPVAAIGLIILTLLALAVVVTREYTEQRRIRVVSRNPIKRMSLPRGWVEVEIGDGGSPGLAQRTEYRRAGEREVSVHIDDQAGEPGSGNAAELRALLDREGGSLDSAELEAVMRLIGSNGCQEGSAESSRARIEDIKGKRVLIVESRCSSRAPYDSYAVIVPADDDPAVWAREIVYSAPGTKYERYLKEFKQALQTIEWAENEQAKIRTRLDDPA